MHELVISEKSQNPRNPLAKPKKVLSPETLDSESNDEKPVPIPRQTVKPNKYQKKQMIKQQQQQQKAQKLKPPAKPPRQISPDRTQEEVIGEKMMPNANSNNNNLDNLPNFRMAQVASTNVNQKQTKKKRKSKKSGRKMIVGTDGKMAFVSDESDASSSESSESETESVTPNIQKDILEAEFENQELLDDMDLFSMEQPTKPTIKTKPKVTPKPPIKRQVSGLTEEEKQQLEEAKKEAEEKLKEEEEMRRIKVQKAVENREAKAKEMSQKMEKSRQLKIESDLRARAKAEAEMGAMNVNEDDLRHHLNINFDGDNNAPYKKKVEPNSVSLEIADDDLLPIRSSRKSSSTSISSAVSSIAKHPIAPKRDLSQYTSVGLMGRKEYANGLKDNYRLLKVV